MESAGTAEAEEACAIEQVRAAAYVIPTERPESDGTLQWDRTTLITAELSAGGEQGFGYTYADASCVRLIREVLAPVLEGKDAFDVPACLTAMLTRVRNLGQTGLVAMAISAVDAALWDLKAKLFGISLTRLLGAARDRVPVYGSGGFTSLPTRGLEQQLAHWAEQGIDRVKMKVGTHPDSDLDRVLAAREAIGPDVALFVDANGAYTTKQALQLADEFARVGVRWLEEPVSSDNLDGLRLVRERAPAGMDIAAGEYGDGPRYFRRMLAAQSVDVLQADATRCLGISGFLAAGTLADAFEVPLSAHCAPSLHVAACCAVPRLAHLEYFFDHVRIEQQLFDGALTPVDGQLIPDARRPGLGIELKRPDAERYAV